MSGVTVKVGVGLIVLGVAGYFASGMVSPTALIPAAFGAVLAGLGAAARSDARRQTMMHLAMLVALLGIIGSFGGVLALPALASGTAERPAAVIARAAMALLLIWYLTMGVRSFLEARRARQR
jgi:thiol:disulfide interchange protein